MKKSIKTIGTVVTIVIMSVCSYIAGTTQAKTENKSYNDNKAD